jgi:hypothetical protein
VGFWMHDAAWVVVDGWRIMPPTMHTARRATGALCMWHCSNIGME